MNRDQEIRDLRLQWSQCIQDGNQNWTERKFPAAEKSFRRAFAISRKISAKTGKPDVAVEVTLKTLVEFQRSRGYYLSAAMYYGLTGLWLMERWVKSKTRR